MRTLIASLLVIVSACSKAPAPTAATAPAATTAKPAPEAKAPEAKPATAETKAPEASAPEAKPAEAKPPEAKPEDAKAALTATCTKLADANRAALAEIDKDVKALAIGPDELAKVDPKGVDACAQDASGAGAWIITLDKHKVTKAGGEFSDGPELRLAYAVVFVGADGSETRWAPEANPDLAPFNVRIGGGVEQNTIERVADWDGDGTVDVLLRRHYRAPDVDATSFRLMRTKDAAVAAWDATGGAPIHAVEDVDGDGKFDLLSAKPFAINPGLRDDIAPGTVRALWHATASGFVTDDEATKAYYTKACGGAKVVLADKPKSDGEGDLMDHLVCARLWGASGEEVAKVLGAYVKKAYEGAGDGDELSKPYLPTPPVTLQ